MNRIKGDLLSLAESGEFDVIVHGCNCFCTMGSGIARQIKDKYPMAYIADCHTAAGDEAKLGTYTQSKSPLFNGHWFRIINAYTQYGFNRTGESADLFKYAAFKEILVRLVLEFPKAKFGFPMIGMGLAGGAPDKIISMLESFAGQVDFTGGSVTLVEYAPEI